MNQEAMKEEEKEDEGQEKEEEEKYTVEYVPFQKITMKGAKNSFKDKAKILMCCKFTPLGYNVEHKIYSRVQVYLYYTLEMTLMSVISNFQMIQCFPLVENTSSLI